MISQPDQYEVLVVGAGQSGLAIGYYLKRLGTDFVLFDASDGARPSILLSLLGGELCPEYGGR